MALGAPLDQNTNNPQEFNASQGYQTALYSLFVLFFMMGFITCLNDILLPYLKKVFDLSYTQASLIQVCFFSAYAIMSIPSSMVVKKLGYKTTMISGFSVAALGCLLFLPAVTFHSYGIFLFALFVLATGIVLLQVAGNPYVSILGSSETASARLTLAQALNSVGTFLAPYFGAYFILSKLKETTDASAVEIPYIGLAVTLIVIAVILSRISLPAVQSGNDTSSDEGSAWSYSHLVFGVIGIFMYVGGEVAIGSYLISYLGQPEIAGLTEETGAAFVSYYWGGAMVGRFVGTWLLSQFQPGKVLTTFAILAVAMIAISISTTGQTAMWSIILVGFFNSIMFPTIFTLAVKGLGKHTAQASGFLSTAIVGGAIIPFLFGICVDMVKESTQDEAYGLRLAFIIPIVCYAYIAWYGVSGSKVKTNA
ncbi:MAG: sugar MFS transporter [Cytophagaceae bacterium]|jgi:FHS family L-fucose permease-like MFS transporter|nr:sugar MFS transporter [Cytophagaceae bacterium]